MTVAGFFLTVNALMFTKYFFAGRYYLVSCAALETIFCYVKKLKYIPILKAKIKSLKRVEESLKSQTVPTLSLDHVLIGTFEIIKEKKGSCWNGVIKVTLMGLSHWGLLAAPSQTEPRQFAFPLPVLPHKVKPSRAQDGPSLE